jgi:hypothetical protein
MPFPGQGGTYSIGTDRYPITVCRVEEEGRRIGICHDRARGRGLFITADPAREPEHWFRFDGHCFRHEGRRYGQILNGRRDRYLEPDVLPVW